MSEDILLNRLNFNATVFKGCSMNEMVVIVVLSAGVWLTACSTMSLLLLGSAKVGIIIAIFLTFASGMSIPNHVNKFKQNRPEGFLKQGLALKLEELNLKPSPFINVSQKWSVRKTLRTRRRK